MKLTFLLMTVPSISPINMPDMEGLQSVQISFEGSSGFITPQEVFTNKSEKIKQISQDQIIMLDPTSYHRAIPYEADTESQSHDSPEISTGTNSLSRRSTPINIEITDTEDFRRKTCCNKCCWCCHGLCCDFEQTVYAFTRPINHGLNESTRKLHQYCDHFLGQCCGIQNL